MNDGEDANIVFCWWEPLTVCVPERNRNQRAPFLWIYTDISSDTPCEQDPVVEFLHHCTSTVAQPVNLTPSTSRTIDTCTVFGEIPVSSYRQPRRSPDWTELSGNYSSSYVREQSVTNTHNYYGELYACVLDAIRLPPLATLMCQYVQHDPAYVLDRLGLVLTRCGRDSGCIGPPTFHNSDIGKLMVNDLRTYFTSTGPELLAIVAEYLADEWSASGGQGIYVRTVSATDRPHSIFQFRQRFPLMDMMHTYIMPRETVIEEFHGCSTLNLPHRALGDRIHSTFQPVFMDIIATVKFLIWDRIPLKPFLRDDKIMQLIVNNSHYHCTQIAVSKFNCVFDLRNQIDWLVFCPDQLVSQTVFLDRVTSQNVVPTPLGYPRFWTRIYQQFKHRFPPGTYLILDTYRDKWWWVWHPNKTLFQQFVFSR